MSKATRRQYKREQRRRKALAERSPPNISLDQTAGLPPIIAAGLSAQVTRSYAGPIPPPEMLQEFDRVEPGRAAKLMQLAEDQSRHRMRLEDMVIRSDLRRSWAGLACGFVVAMTVVCTGGWLVHEGHEVAGTIFAGSGLTSLVGTFIYGTLSRRRERVEKVKLMSGKR